MNRPAAIEIQFSLRSPAVVTAGPLAAPSRGRLPRITQVLALAIHLESMIQSGEAKDYADLARLYCLCRERVSQIVRLNYLAPDIQIELLYLPAVPGGRYPISETAARRIASILSWAKQRLGFKRFKI